MRVQLHADGWDLDIVLDEPGQLSAETEVVFELIFEERPRVVRCRPAEAPVGTFLTTALTDTGELAGSFDIELARCEDTETGASLDWPPQPFVLHGSFDKLALGDATDGR